MSIVQVLLDAARSENWDQAGVLAEKLVSFDVETWLIQPGILAPPLVCASIGYYNYRDQEISSQLVDADGARDAFRALLRDRTSRSTCS
jgi:hypothetical protein